MAANLATHLPRKNESLIKMKKVFEPENYRKEIEASRRRRKIAFSFQEPDRVPINISVGGAYFAHLFGCRIKDYYTSREVMVEVQSKSLPWRFEVLKDDNENYEIALDLGQVYEALFFNCPIYCSDLSTPRAVPILKSVKDIENLKVPDPSDHPKVNWVWEEAEKTRKILKKKKIKLPFSRAHFQIHPPLSAACAIMDPTNVYTLMYTEPKAVFLLLDKLFESFCKLIDFSDKRNGIKRRDSIGLCDDNSAFISSQMYREFALPYNKRIYERYGKKSRFLHADGPNDHLFPILANELKLTIMDIGGFSSLERAVKVMKGKTVIHGGLNNKDLYEGLTQKTKRKIREAVRLAAPEGGYEFAIGGETYVKIAPETLVNLVNYVKKIGKYPIQEAIENECRGCY